jgi:heptosyltransferase-2
VKNLKQKRILIVRTDRVGDTVMVTAMARELKKTFKDCFVATLTQPNTSVIFQNNPNVDKIITDDLSKETFWEVVKKLRKEKFTDALLVLPTERAAYQLFFAGIRNRVITGTKFYGTITFMKSVSRNNYIPLRHEADYCMDLARKIGVVTDNFQPEIFLSDEEIQEAEKFYASLGIDKNSFRMMLHTGSKNSAPNWSEDKYFELIKNISEKYKNENYVLLLTAFEMSDDLKEKVRSLGNEKIYDVSGKIGNLRQFIKVIGRADLMICSSTGPIHLAGALDVRCIGIHCHRNVSSATHWGVVNKKSVNLEVSKEYCDANCSADKKVCAFENGLQIEDVINNIDLKLFDRK